MRDAYRRLVKRGHPDCCPNDPGATRRFQAIRAAYEAIAAGGRLAATQTETVLWRASHDGELLVLTTTRLVHHVTGRAVRWEVVLRDVKAVLVRPLPRSHAAVLVRTSMGRHSIALPQPLAVPLAELLTDGSR